MKRATKIIILLLILILTASFYACNKKGHTISFLSFGEEIASINHKGTGNIELIIPTKEGYEFLGWFLDENEWQNPFTDTYFFDKKIDKNYTVYAKWQPLQYITVTFETFSTEVKPILVIKGTSLSLPVPTREGYTFLCWCKNEYLNSAVDSKTILKKDIKLYAKWLAKSPLAQNFTISIVSIGERVLKITAEYGKILNIPQTRRVGYKLENYYVDEKYTEVYDKEMLVTSSFTLYAAWYDVDENYTVSYNTNGGEHIAPRLVRYNELIVSQTTIMDGYIFEGWYADNNLTKKFDFANTGITSNTVLYAKWTKEEPIVVDKDTYIITYINNGGEGILTTSAKFGEEPNLSIPTIAGVNFIGWYFDELLTNPYVYNPNNRDDITLYAKWEHQIENADYLFSESSIGNGLKIVSYKGSSQTITLPQNINGQNVIEIGDRAFINNATITKVTFTSFITNIGAEAFANCTSLIEIASYGNIQTIGVRAFAKCKITRLNFTEQLQSIGNQAFAESEIESITLNSDASVGEEAFEKCLKLKAVNMSAVKIIYQRAFAECKVLETVNFAQCKDIWNGAFFGCINLVTIDLPRCLRIGSTAFEGCSSLKTVNIPLVEEIDEGAFRHTSIEQISLPKVVQIGGGAFADCKKLTNVTIGEALARIGGDSDIFSGSNKLNIVVALENQVFSSKDGSLLNKEGSQLICVGGIDNFVYNIPNGVVNISMFAFASGTTIKSLFISSSVKNVDMSLAIIEDLEEITVDEGNQFYKIVDRNLYDSNDMLIRYMPKSNLTEFTISETTTAIFMGAFSFCRSLQIITLNNALTTVNWGTFYKCFSLVEVRNTEHITVFENYCFYQCNNLTTITFGEGVTQIGFDSFTETQVPIESIPDKIVK